VNSAPGETGLCLTYTLRKTRGKSIASAMIRLKYLPDTDTVATLSA